MSSPQGRQPDQEPPAADRTGDGAEPPDIFPTVYVDADDAADVADLTAAEQAVARNGGTAEQRDGVARAGTVRRAEDRLDRWRERRRT